MNRRKLLKGVILTSFLHCANKLGLQRAGATTLINKKIPKISVDVHAHFIPEIYRKELIAAGHSHPDGMPGIPPWSEKSALTLMDRLGIETSILSISSPGVHFGNALAAKKLAREVNEIGASIIKKSPKRFGLFAVLPLPELSNAIAEGIYALDVLKADGIVLETNYHGLYLGDSRLSPLYKELEKRKAVVFIHPISPSCNKCGSLSLGYPLPMLEFMFETTRSVTNLILSGTIKKYPNIRWIIPHGGSALTIFAERIAGMATMLKLPSGITGDDFRATLKSFYYDLASSPIPNQLPATLSLADHNKILYGSDTPFTPDEGVLFLKEQLVNTELLNEELLNQIFSTNARALFPRLSKE